MNKWNWDRLKVVLAILDEGGVTEGGRRLGLSQPAVTHAIRKLEEEIGIRIFAREKKRFSLTQAGIRVAEVARKIADLCAELDPVAASQTHPESEWLRIGLSNRVDRGSAVDRVSRYHEQAGADSQLMRMQMRSGTHSELLGLLQQGEIDLLITAESHLLAAVEPQDKTLLVATFDIPVRLFIARKSEWSRLGMSEEGSGRELIEVLKKKFKDGVPVLLPDVDHPFRQELDRFIERSQIPVRPILEADTFAVLMSALMSGVGFCFLPASLLPESLQKLRIFGPKEGLWRQNVLLLRSHHARFPEKIQEMGEFLTRSWTFDLDRD